MGAFSGIDRRLIERPEINTCSGKFGHLDDKSPLTGLVNIFSRNNTVERRKPTVRFGNPNEKVLGFGTFGSFTVNVRFSDVRFDFFMLS